MDPATPSSRALPALTLPHVVLFLVVVCLLVFRASSGIALLAGITIALTTGNPWPARTRAWAKKTLTWSVIGLGAGMNVVVIGKVGLTGVGFTVLGIACALLLGTVIGRVLRVGRDVSLLISVGTAICGGSAIAAVSPIIHAEDHDVSMAMIVVFLLNAIALWVFPAIGHNLHLDQIGFGTWAALAIHDTSSVVAAASSYGSQALEIATSIKLARALWIIPLSLAVAMWRAREAKESAKTAKPAPRPWFIAGFVAASALVTLVPSLHDAGQFVAATARQMLTLTLFLIGLGMSRAALRTLGLRPLLEAVLLWISMATITLFAVLRHWI